ncbi:MAG: hypothetical protein K0B15_16630 [Lentimicrobium sp.]|nr:hypothetical protein [Lentimicrobium sp.]
MNTSFLQKAISLLLITYVFILISSNSPIKEKAVWRLINPDTLSLEDAFWFDYYNENAVGAKFWQLEFLDTSLIEYRSLGVNILHETYLGFQMNNDTLILIYPRNYEFDNFTKSGRYLRSQIEKYHIQEYKDTLTLTFISVKYTLFDKEHFEDKNTIYRFVKPLDKSVFPDYLMHAPKNKQDIVKIMNNLYSREGIAQLIEHFDSLPDFDNYTRFGNIRTMIFSDIINVFNIENNAILQELFDHYHPEVIAGGIIGMYLDYLKQEKSPISIED